MKRIFNIFSIVILAAVFFSCKENSFEKQRENELNQLNEYIRANHPGEVPRPRVYSIFQLKKEPAIL